MKRLFLLNYMVAIMLLIGVSRTFAATPCDISNFVNVLIKHTKSGCDAQTAQAALTCLNKNCLQNSEKPTNLNGNQLACFMECVGNTACALSNNQTDQNGSGPFLFAYNAQVQACNTYQAQQQQAQQTAQQKAQQLQQQNSASICTNWEMNCSGQNYQANPNYLKILNSTGKCTAQDNDCDLSYLSLSDIQLAPGVTLTDLSGANLTCANLSYMDLSNVNLGTNSNIGTNLTNACLAHSTLKNMSNANLFQASLSNAQAAPGADFSGAAFYYTDLTNANLSNTKLEKAGFYQAQFQNTNFTNSDLQNLSEGQLVEMTSGNLENEPMDLRQAQNLTQANFTNANMSGVNLSGLDLNGMQLSGVNLTNANLSATQNVIPLINAGNKVTGANLSTVDFSNQTIKSGINLSNTILAGANLTKTIAKGVSFNGASFYFNRCDAGDADCVNVAADISEADFTGSDFRNVKDLYLAENLKTANFSQINGTNLEFNGQAQGRQATNDMGALLDMQSVNLSGANLTGADLGIINFGKANLSNANLSNADLAYSSFNGANLQNAILNGTKNLCYTAGANFTGATLNNCTVQGNLCGKQNFKGAKGTCTVNP